MTILAKLTTQKPEPEPVKKPRAKAFQAVAEAVGTLRQYQDVPLRFQRQWIAAFLTLMVLIGIIGGLYLTVVSRTAITGREIQNLQAEIVVGQNANADLQTHIATLLSNESLQARAQAAGYAPIKGEELDYITVQGYFPDQNIAPVTPPAENIDLSLSPDFSESLSSWLARQIETASLPLAQEH